MFKCSKTITFLFLLTLTTLNILASSKMHFQNLSIREGLSNLNIKALCQDNQGYLWIGTNRGLNRFNGYEFKHYFYNKKDPLGLVSDQIGALYCNNDNLLFIGTFDGLSCFDITSEKFIYPFDQRIKKSVNSITKYGDYILVGTDDGLYRLKDNFVQRITIENKTSFKANALFVDSNDKLWVGLANDLGIACFDKIDSKPIVIRRKDKNITHSQNTILCIAETSSKRILAGTEDGIFTINSDTKEINESESDLKLTEPFHNQSIQFIFEKEPFRLWIGALKSGLYTIDILSGELSHYYSDDPDRHIKSNNLQTLFCDNIGNLWMGTFDNGLEILYKYSKNFNPNHELSRFTDNNFITRIVSKNDEGIIMGTHGRGLMFYDAKKHTIKRLTVQNSQLENNIIRDLFIDKTGKIWVSHFNGIQIYDSKNATFKKVKLNLPNKGSSATYCDGKYIYAGINPYGLCVFDFDGHLISSTKEKGNNITRILPIDNDKLLISVFGSGVYIYNKSTKNLAELPDKLKKQVGLDKIVTGYIDSENIIWLGGYLSGLFRINLNTNDIRNFDQEDGLPSNDVVSIEDDFKGNLWLSTSYGLARFDKSKFSTKTYFLNEGVNNFQFHEKSSFHDTDGMIYFGGNYGLTFFNPSDLEVPNTHPYNVIIESISVLNKEIKPRDPTKILEKGISFTDKIVLSHLEKELSIKCTAFDYLSPQQIQYLYKLDGYDDTWYNFINRRTISYSNLPPGEYTFNVKTINSEGIGSSNIAQLKVKVRPAPLLSPLAIIIYILLIILVVYLGFKFTLKIKLYKKELEIEHNEHSREKEIHEMKLRFFTNISHEFRTPLTILSGMAKLLAKKVPTETEPGEIVQSLQMNIHRLLNLVNQLMVFRKLENDTLNLYLEKGNIAEHIEQISKSFSYFAIQKKINIVINDIAHEELYFDRDKLDKILTNLIANAVKFTPEGGKITISSHLMDNFEAIKNYELLKNNIAFNKGKFYEINVSDTGVGIEATHLKSIFLRYRKYDFKGKKKKDYSSTGIGLEFSRRLLEMHHGAIRVESTPGKGSIFSFIIPQKEDGYSKEDFFKAEHIENNSSLNIELTVPLTTNFKIKEQKNKQILVVEDDPELNQLLTKSLNPYFKVLNAYDGLSALKLTTDMLPDIVVSDVMMPVMNGLELCTAIKDDELLSHIPVILLSAKTNVDDQISGLTSGADVYIPKPFDFDYLLAVIDSQLKNRSKILKMFLEGRLPKAEKTEMVNRDFLFLKKVNQILESEYSKPDLNIDHLACMMNLGRTSFYRKFLSITTVTPNNYIKKFRIEKAKVMIRKGQHNMAEISDLIGFSGPAYFSTAFKAETNQTPREYQISISDTDNSKA